MLGLFGVISSDTEKDPGTELIEQAIFSEMYTPVYLLANLDYTKNIISRTGTWRANAPKIWVFSKSLLVHMANHSADIMSRPGYYTALNK